MPLSWYLLRFTLQEFDLEELMEKLIFVEKVEQGLKYIEEGKTVDHAQVKEMVKKW